MSSGPCLVGLISHISFQVSTLALYSSQVIFSSSRGMGYFTIVSWRTIILFPLPPEPLGPLALKSLTVFLKFSSSEFCVLSICSSLAIFSLSDSAIVEAWTQFVVLLSCCYHFNNRVRENSWGLYLGRSEVYTYTLYN